MIASQNIILTKQKFEKFAGIFFLVIKSSNNKLNFFMIFKLNFMYFSSPSFMPGQGFLRALLYLLLYKIALSPHSPNLATFLPTPMQMPSMFPVPTPMIIIWLRLLPPFRQIIRSRRMSEA